MATQQIDQERLATICRSDGISRAVLFCALARGEGRPDSDLDLLVTFASPRNLHSVVRLERELGAVLGRTVDLLTEWAISQHLRKGIAGDFAVVHGS